MQMSVLQRYVYVTVLVFGIFCYYFDSLINLNFVSISCCILFIHLYCQEKNLVVSFSASI